MAILHLTRKEHFNAAHRLWNPDWSEEKNYETFGICANPHFHGHNFDLYVTVKGTPNPETGCVIDLKILKIIIRKTIIEELDHKNLNLDVPDFLDLNPTAENIAVVIWNKLREHIDTNKELEVVLYETPRNFVTYKGN